jgi:predicted translin family RNA/ssDNA-binding protein
MESISTIEIEVKSIDREIAGLQQMIGRIRGEIVSAQYDDKLRQLSSQLRFLENEKDVLGEEYTQLMRQGESRLKLGLAREKSDDLNKQISTT